MLERLKAGLAWHWATGLQVLRLTPLWVWITPAVAAGIIYLLNRNAAIAPFLTKEAAEISSPVVLAVALALAVWRAITSPHVYYKWLALFALALLLRELHFQGTNTGFYIAVPLLLGWASLARERLEPFISSRKVVGLLVTILWIYLVSKSFDRHAWNAVLPAGTTSNLFEENLELAGHLLFLALVVVSIGVEGGVPAPSRIP